MVEAQAKESLNYKTTDAYKRDRPKNVPKKARFLSSSLSQYLSFSLSFVSLFSEFATRFSGFKPRDECFYENLQRFDRELER